MILIFQCTRYDINITIYAINDVKVLDELLQGSYDIVWNNIESISIHTIYERWYTLYDINITIYDINITILFGIILKVFIMKYDIRY
jgi:hypothetical protein